jgi:Trypsin-co-occurring domain 1
VTNNNPNSDHDVRIFIEPSEARGFKQVISFKKSKEELSKQAEQAIKNTMKVIRNMITTVNTTIEGVEATQKPKHVEVQFGIKFDGELDIIIAHVLTTNIVV